MRPRLVPVLLAALALPLAACDARPAAEGGYGPAPTTGAHTAHLTGSAIAKPVTCEQCHDARFQVTLQGNLAAANGAQGTFSASTMTCSNVYCHAGGPSLLLGGGTLTAPVWNPPSSIACGACHAIPGGTVDTSAWHTPVAAGVQCGLCHPGYTRTDVNRELHVNAVADLTVADLGTSCTACHGDATRVVPPGVAAVVRAAPPVDRRGRSDTSLPAVGAHQAHLAPGSAAIAPPIACGECHVVPTNLVHVGPLADSPAKLAWGPVASAAAARPAYDATTATCTNYCHGQTLAAGGTDTTPVWTKVDGTQAACGTCHGIPPPDMAHVSHVSVAAPDFPCSTCHPPGYSRLGVGAAAIPFHVNGVRNVNTTNLPGWNPNAAGPNGWTGTSTGCHGGTRYWTPGAAAQPGCW